MKKRKYKKARSAPVHLEKKTIITVLGISLFLFSLLLLASIFTQAGALLSLKDYFYNLFGIGVVLVPFVLILLSFPLLSIKLKFIRANLIIGLVGALLSFLGMIAAFSENLSGVLGTSLWQVTKSLLSPIGAFLMLILAFAATVVIASNANLSQTAKILALIFKKLLALFKFLKKNSPWIFQTKICH